MPNQNIHKELTLKQICIFWMKSRLLILNRFIKNSRSNISLYQPQKNISFQTDLIYEVVTPLYTETNHKEKILQLGKVQNIRVAINNLNNIIIPQNGIFSFWKQVGRPTQMKGFVKGRELRQGCLIPTIAGGICQISNSLYQVAKHSGMEILERHGHTQQIEDSAFRVGEDATVFWNYVDFRFRTPFPVLLKIFLTPDNLVVKLERIL